MASKLILEGKRIKIINDQQELNSDIKCFPWVTALMHGNITDISMPERIITIAYEGEQVRFKLQEEASIAIRISDYAVRLFSFDEIVVGDYISSAWVFINSTNLEMPEARAIIINRGAEIITPEMPSAEGTSDKLSPSVPLQISPVDRSVLTSQYLE